MTDTGNSTDYPPPNFTEPEERPRPDFTRFIALDIETTGLEPSTSDIIELGAVRYINGREEEHFHSLVKLDGVFPERNRRLTGIEPEQLASGIPIGTALEKFLEFIGPDLIVSHNSQFDMGFLEHHLKLAGLPSMKNPSLCTLHLAALVNPEEETLQLGTLAERWGIRVVDSHRALQDARSAGFLALELIKEIASWDREFLRHLSGYRGKSEDPIYDLVDYLAGDEVGNSGAVTYRLDEKIIGILHESKGQKALQEFRILEYERETPSPDSVYAAEISQAFTRGGLTLLEDLRPNSQGAAGCLGSDELDVKQLVIGVPEDSEIRNVMYGFDTDTDGFGGENRSFYLGRRSEYICFRRTFGPDGRPKGWIELSPYERLVIARWLAGTKTGRPGRLNWWLMNNFSGLKGSLNFMSSEGMDCIRLFDQSDPVCFVEMARFRAINSDRIVVDFRHLFTPHSTEIVSERLLAPLKTTLIDGSGKLVEAARTAVTRTLEVDPLHRRIKNLLRKADIKNTGVLRALESSLEVFNGLKNASRDALQNWREKHNYSDSGTVIIDRENWDDPEFGSLASESLASGELVARTGKLLQDSDESDSDIRSLGNALIMTSKFLTDFRSVPHDWCACIEGMPLRNPKRIYLKLAPLTVGDAFRKLVDESSDGLVISGRHLRYSGSFEWLLSQWKLSADTSVTERVLDLPVNIIPPLFVPVDITPPSARANKKYLWQKYIERTANLLRMIAEALDGHTVAAFSAHHDLKNVRDLLGINPPRNCIVLAQYSDGTRSALVREYLQNPATLLLGGRNFFSGLNLRPAGFTALVVVKLPFSSPDDPINRLAMQGAEKDGLDGIRTHLVPVAVDITNRWIDCLIAGPTGNPETENNISGAVIILDPRADYQDWGDEFVGALNVGKVHNLPFRDMLSKLKELKNGNPPQ